MAMTMPIDMMVMMTVAMAFHAILVTIMMAPAMVTVSVMMMDPVANDDGLRGRGRNSDTDRGRSSNSQSNLLH